MTEAQNEAPVNWCQEMLKKFKLGTAKFIYNIVKGDKIAYICVSWKLNNNSLFRCFQMN